MTAVNSLFHLQGGKALYEKLQSIPVAMEKKIMRKALRAGAAVIARQARATVPVRTGALRRSIRMRTAYRRGKALAYAIAGGSRIVKRKGVKTLEDAYWAGWVEFGSVHNEATRFMSNALKAAGPSAISTIQRVAGEELEKYLRKALNGPR